MFKSAEMSAYQPKFAPREPVAAAPPAVIVLPWPPSVNHMYYHRACGKFVQKGLTKEGKTFIAAVGAIVTKSGQKIMDGPVIIQLWFYRPRQIGDLDNYIKATLDGITGAGWTDDRQVVEIHAYRRDDKHNPRVELLFERARDDGDLFEVTK